MAEGGSPASAESPPPPRTGLSCCIITRNEADRITRCIEAVRGVADDIVVVDSGSTDGTPDIARALGARVFHRDWTGYGPQKRFAEDCAAHDWVLNLDADEVATPELAAQIDALMRQGPPLSAYRFRIREVYPGADRPRLWADFQVRVRLYDRTRARFRDSAVHDTVDTGALEVGNLTGSVTHYTARSWAHIRQKLDSYTSLQAKVMKKPAWVLMARLPFEYPLVFFRYYVLRCHFTGGWGGVYSAHIAGRARFLRLVKMLRAKRAAR